MIIPLAFVFFITCCSPISALENEDAGYKSIYEINEEAKQKGTLPDKVHFEDIATDPDEPKDDDRYYKRAAVRNVHYLWDRANIPYMLSSTLAASTKTTIRKALSNMESKTCLKFNELSSPSGIYINYYKGSGCWSSGGKRYWKKAPYAQYISIGGGCGSQGVIIHETLHALGFFHEQSRPDRDKYVEILWENISPGKASQFRKMSKSSIDSRGGQYDPGSLMHYKSYYFSKNGEDTIRSITGQTLGQRSGMSKGDIVQVNAVYQCSNTGTTGFSEWTSWGPCDGSYKSKRQRFCFGGNCTGANRYGVLEETRQLNCSNPFCQVNGHWGKWSCWKICDVQCGIGRRERTRKCNDPTPKCGGSACVGNSTSYRTCYGDGTTINCPDLCTTTTKGKEYRGNMSTTLSGRTCQTWTSQTPHSHKYTPSSYPKDGLLKNYCRNPDNTARPWCYTIDKNKRWEYCPVIVCAETKMCKTTMKGEEYRGNLSTTISGRTCQAWSSQTPHSHSLCSAHLKKNYCRNPDDSGKGPWCYTTDKKERWEYCSVPFCPDKNECTSGTHNCHSQANCQNTDGSFTCTCKTGYTGNGVNCADNNECTSGTHNCHSQANCQNTDGNFTCTCKVGYTGDGINCADKNECTSGTHNCHSQANCQNTDGSFTCTCKAGYTGNGVNCADKNECTSGTNNCHSQANCQNTDGSFTCTCKAGYTGNGVNCADNNECTSGTHNCHSQANCQNTDGSFTCTCKAGYTGNGVNCADNNECTSGTHNCHSQANCQNTDGSFTCTCGAGYTGDGVSCADNNECTSGTNNCHSQAECRNTDGSFTCTCKTGYTGNGVNCSDNNECTSGIHNCHSQANCHNTDGSFTCTCKAGYTGSGINCIDYCKKTTMGKEFRGTISTTTAGKTCQAWASQKPHRHTRTPTRYPNSGLESNYCRNPDNESKGPWCYTTSSTRWDYCPVPLCSVNVESEDASHKSIYEINEEAKRKGTLPDKVRFEDIATDPDEPNDDSRDYKRSAIRNVHYLWDRANIPFMLSSTLSDATKTKIRGALSDIESKTCLKFNELSSPSGIYMNYYKGGGCWSLCGKLYWKTAPYGQSISIGGGCAHHGIIIHETLHALGFYHEQMRPDRDDYVEILWENMSPGAAGQYAKYSKSQIDNRGTQYDPGSMMHYWSNFFSKNGADTMRSITGQKLGHWGGMSDGDIVKVNAVYHCKDTGTTGFSQWTSWGPCDGSYKSKRQRFCFGGNCTGANQYGIQDETRQLNCSHPVCQVNGHWGRWSCWKICSVQCGIGRRERTRKCNDPAPKCGGAACVGNSTSYRTCYGDGTTINCPGICKATTKGREYRGNISTTLSGRTCQAWTSQTPNSHTYTPSKYPKAGLVKNYCRNPDNIYAPWCYTIDKKKRWEFCPVILCAETKMCKTTMKGEEYIGNLSTTISGRTCQAWSSQTPHSHSYCSENLKKNYCRNPSASNVPWCYTTDKKKRWEYCSVPFCPDKNECTTGTHNCHLQANCHNTDGSFTCTCKAGYTGNGVNCADNNECTSGTHNCHLQANCKNTDGSFTCTCKAGYTGNGVSCVDSCTLYVKKGCYQREGGKKKMLNELLINRRSSITWPKYQVFLERLVCSCAEEARRRNYTVFGIQFWGECWATNQNKTTIFSRLAQSNSCASGSFGQCSTSDRVCTGKKQSTVVYYLK